MDKVPVLAALAALGAEGVLPLLRITARRSGVRFRTATCPARGGDHSRGDAVVVEETGVFHCKACQAGGDLLTFAALMLGHDPRRDFPGALAAVADLIGVEAGEADDSTRARQRRLLAEREAAAARRRAEQQAIHRRAEAGAAHIWERLSTTSERGLAYLCQRRLDAAAGEVRFGRRHVCLPLRAADGAVRNIAGRRIDGGQPKVRCLKDCRKVGYAFGDLRKLATTSGPIVVVEGLADFLAARLRWPDRLVFGADGCDCLPHVARMLALVAVDRGLVLVPHRDAAGIGAVERATVAATAAGISADAIEIFDVAPHGDLADLWRAAA